MTVHNIQTRQEYHDAIKNNAVVFLDAFAEWCGPCKMIAPKIAELSNMREHKDIYFAKFDVDEMPDVAMQLEVQAMPTFYVFVDGKKADTVVGVNPPKLIKAIQMASVESQRAAAAKAGEAAGAKEAEAVGEDKTEVKTEEKVEGKAEEKAEEKPEEKAEEKAEEKPEDKPEDKPEEKKAEGKPEDGKLETDRQDW